MWAAACLPCCPGPHLPTEAHSAPTPFTSPPCRSGYQLSFNIPADGTGSMREREPLMPQARPALVQAAPSFGRGYSTYFDA